MATRSHMIDDHETLPSHKPYTRSKIGLESKEVEDSRHQADSTRSRSHT